MDTGIFGVLGWGVAGFFVGVGYKVTHNRLRHTKNAAKLEPKTDVLWKNDELFNLCLRLQKFSKYDTFNFQQAIINIDRLLYFHQICREDEFEVQPEDRKIAYGHFKTVQDHLRNLHNSIYSQGTPKQAAQSKDLYGKVMDILKNVWLGILKRIIDQEE
jgi:hypothetical protein